MLCSCHIRGIVIITLRISSTHIATSIFCHHIVVAIKSVFTLSISIHHLIPVLTITQVTASTVIITISRLLINSQVSTYVDDRLALFTFLSSNDNNTGSSFEKVPVVVCGGQGGNEPAPEAVVMRDVLIGLGVDEDMILMDTTSASTHSNIKNAMQLLAGRNVTKVMIITSDYHLPRAIAIAEDNGLTAYGVGAPTKLGLRFWLKNHCREALAWCKYWAVKYTHLPLE